MTKQLAFLAALLTAVLTCLLPSSAWAKEWPEVALPFEAKPFDIGGEVTVNGLPMRIRGFVSPGKAAQTAEWFRRQLGKPLVENNVGGKLILGRAQGEYYLTVQIEAVQGEKESSRGTVAVTHLKAAQEQQAQSEADRAHWLSRLPSGSTLVSDMVSQDGGKISRHLVFVNKHGESLNRERIKHLMNEDGFVLEREAAPNGESSSALFFKGTGKEAIATVKRDSQGLTTNVLNTVKSMERFQ